VPESNLFFDEKSSFPQATQVNIPSFLKSTYLPLNGGSVPFFLNILYWLGGFALKV
jgi:hypothetical protein